jgi:phage baseplate assembly protein V
MNGALMKRALAPLTARLQMMVSRAVVRLVEDAGGLQTLQVAAVAGEVLDGVERFGEYGLASRPHPGAEALVVCVGGLRSHGIVVSVGDRRFRLKGLETGEVALHDDQGQVVKLARAGIEISTPLKVAVTAPEVTVTAETKVIVDCPLVHLGGEGGKKVARHDDPVVSGKVVASTSRVFAT